MTLMYFFFIYLQQEWKLTNEQVAEYKEVFMLFDKDEDGVLSFPELSVVMKSLGQRPSGKIVKQQYLYSIWLTYDPMFFFDTLLFKIYRTAVIG